MSEPNLDYYHASIKEADEFNQNLFLHDVRKCHRCELSRADVRETCPINCYSCPGFFTSLPLDLLFVGQNPGKDEDKVGRPFVGKAGKKLMELADSINLITSDTMVGFTNVVRCLTPDNRPPTGQEVQACSRWMQVELDMTEPKIVILLGNTALSLAFENKRIGEVAGSARAIGNTIYIASYHPAAALHKKSPVIIESILSSLRLAKKILDK